MSKFICPHCHHELVVRALGDSAALRKFDHDAARALLRLGVTQTEVAHAFGVTRQAISRIATAPSDPTVYHPPTTDKGA